MGICLSFLAAMSLKYLSNQTNCHQPLQPVQETNSEDLFMSMASKVGEIKNKEQKQVSIIINGRLILTEDVVKPV